MERIENRGRALGEAVVREQKAEALLSVFSPCLPEKRLMR